MKKIICQQTHSNNVFYIGRKENRKIIPECDGLFTDLTGVSLVISTADCLPISIISDKVVGVVHAGWRGLKKGIIQKALKKITNKFSISKKDITVKIGPSIDKDNYPIKKDVYNFFEKDYKEYFEQKNNNQWKMDLKGIAVYQITQFGIPIENIQVSQISTFKNKKYPSYRRDGKTGGFITTVVLK